MEVQQPNQQQPAQQQPVQQTAQPKQATEVLNATQEEKVWGLVSYMPLVSLAVLVLKPGSKFCRLHASQGLVLSVFVFLSFIVVGINEYIGSAFTLLVFVLIVLGAIKAFSGAMYKIPVIAEIAKLVPVDSMIANVSGKAPVKPQAPMQDDSDKANAEANMAVEQPSVPSAPEAVAKESEQTPVEPAMPAEPQAPAQPSVMPEATSPKEPTAAQPPVVQTPTPPAPSQQEQPKQEATPAEKSPAPSEPDQSAPTQDNSSSDSDMG